MNEQNYAVVLIAPGGFANWRKVEHENMALRYAPEIEDGHH
jgi:hypothetical protein